MASKDDGKEFAILGTMRDLGGRPIDGNPTAAGLAFSLAASDRAFDGLPEADRAMFAAIDERDAAALAKALADGAEPNARRGEADTGTALMEAAAANFPEGAISLLRAGASLDDSDWMGWTPLHHASCFADGAVRSILLNAGADDSARDHKGRSPGDLARSSGSAEPDRPLGSATRPH